MCCIAKRRGSTIEEKTHAVKLMKDGNLKQSEIECRTGVAPSTMRLAETHLRINGYSISTHESRLIMSTFCLCLRSVLRSVGRPTQLCLDDELALASWARWCASCNLPRTASMVRQTAKRLAQHRGITLKNCKFGRKWWNLFRERHYLTVGRARRLEPLPPTISQYTKWMEYFGQLISKYSTSRIYNADETGSDGYVDCSADVCLIVMVGWARFSSRGWVVVPKYSATPRVVSVNICPCWDVFQ